MQKIFHNILVPLNLNRRTELSMDKAIEFASELECHVHFLFNLHSGYFSWHKKRKMEIDRKRIHALKEKFQKKVGRRLKIFFQVRNDDIKDHIVNYTGVNEIDMVLLDRCVNGQGLLSDPGKLASDINCPVLSTGHLSEVQPFKTLVLPIEKVVPVNQIRIAVSLAKQFDSSIHLVMLEKNSFPDGALACMQRVFELLKNNTDINVVCAGLRGRNLRDAAIQYSQSVKGSLIAMNAGKEIAAGNWISRFYSLFGNKKSEVPVITVV